MRMVVLALVEMGIVVVVVVVFEIAVMWGSACINLLNNCEDS